MHVAEAGAGSKEAESYFRMAMGCGTSASPRTGVSVLCDPHPGSSATGIPYAKRITSDNEALRAAPGGLPENSSSGALFTVLLTPRFVQPVVPAKWVPSLQHQGFGLNRSEWGRAQILNV